MKLEPAQRHKRKPLSWWNGRTVKLLQNICNRGGCCMKRDTFAIVIDKRGGLAIEGSGTYITRVDYAELLVVVE